MTHLETHEAPQLTCIGIDFTYCIWTIQILEHSLKTTTRFKGPPNTGSFKLDSLLL